MPTVLRVGGFEVMIFLPGREHGPAHVHVYKRGTEVSILLNTGEEEVAIRKVIRMSQRDAWRAVEIVTEHVEFLRDQWRKYHG